MKIIIKKDDGTKEVYQDVSDYYLAVRQPHPLMNGKKESAKEMQTRSYSFGPHLRDLKKELIQSADEIDNALNEKWLRCVIADEVKKALKKENG